MVLVHWLKMDAQKTYVLWLNRNTEESRPKKIGDPRGFMRRHPPHHLSPAWVDHPAGPDPDARLSRPKSPQQRSDQARKPVNSEQDCCSLFPAPVVLMAAVDKGRVY